MKGARVQILRLVVTGLLVTAAYYAFFGGEYSALELRRIGRDVMDASVAVAAIEAETARLERRAHALENDPRTLEILARESFGMIRDGEVLYRFADGGESR